MVDNILFPILQLNMLAKIVSDNYTDEEWFFDDYKASSGDEAKI